MPETGQPRGADDGRDPRQGADPHEGADRRAGGDCAASDVRDRQGRPVPRVTLFQGLRLGPRRRPAMEAAGARSARGGATAGQDRGSAVGTLRRAALLPGMVSAAVRLGSRAAAVVVEHTASPSGVLRYAVAAVVVLLAAAVTLPLWQAVFMSNPFTLFYAAVIVAAWFGGFGPGLLATLLAALAIDELFLPSFLSLRAGLSGAVHVVGFGFVAVLVASLEATRERAMAAMRAAKEGAEHSATAAESASRAKDQFLAVLSHELRTPLTPALAAASAMEGDPSLPARVRGEMGMIRRNIELEARLIDDLLDLTRITRGKLQLSLQPVNLNALIGHVADICRFDLRAKSLAFQCDFDGDASGPGAPYVNADPARLRQVLWNVLKNAIKFTPEGGSVTLRTRLETRHRGHPGTSAGATASAVAESRVAIEIVDTGIGIHPDVLPRIFDAFEQGDRANSHAFGGLGLGLAISRALILAHGGELTAASEGIGRGATFALRLPLGARPADADVPAAPAVTPLAPLAWVAPALAASDAPRAPAVAAVAGDGVAGDGVAGDAVAGDAVAAVEFAEAVPPRRLRVLLVEDHPDTARVMARLLRGDRHDVTVAETLQAALEASAATPFDLIISDLGLPDGNGLDLLRELREERRFAGRAIALSGYGMEEDLRRSREAGFAAHLTKPVNFDALEAVIREVTSAPHAGPPASPEA